MSQNIPVNIVVAVLNTLFVTLAKPCRAREGGFEFPLVARSILVIWNVTDEKIPSTFAGTYSHIQYVRAEVLSDTARI